MSRTKLVILLLVSTLIVTFVASKLPPKSSTIIVSTQEESQDSLKSSLTEMESLTQMYERMSASSSRQGNTEEYIREYSDLHSKHEHVRPSQDDKLVYLMNSYDAYKLRKNDYGLASYCVVTIMRESGRADYGISNEDGTPIRFSLKSKHPDEYRIASDAALYTFVKGEFPVYDFLVDRIRTKTRHITLTEEEEQEIENFYEEALNTLGVYPVDKPG